MGRYGTMASLDLTLYCHKLYLQTRRPTSIYIISITTLILSEWIKLSGRGGGGGHRAPSTHEDDRRGQAAESSKL